jgi:hypothetical protein
MVMWAIAHILFFFSDTYLIEIIWKDDDVNPLINYFVWYQCWFIDKALYYNQLRSTINK